MNQTPDDHPRDLISAYADGEIDASGRASVERHLRACDGCRRLLDDIRTLATANAAEEPPPIPLDLAARIRLRLPAAARAERHSAGRPWWWSPLPLSAAAAILVGGALFLLTFKVLRAPQEEPLVARGESSPPAIPEAPPPAIMKRAPAVDPRRNETDKPRRSSDSAPAPAFAPAPEFAPAPATVKSEAAPAPAGTAAPPKAQAEEKVRALRRQKDARGDSAADAVIPEAGVSPGPAAYKEMPVRPGGRVLILTTPLYEAEILEAGTLTLNAAGYTCAQDLGWLGSAGEAPADALPEDRPPDPMAPRHLFGLASSADFMSAPDSPAARMEPGGPAARSNASRLALMSGNRKVLHAVAFGGLDDRNAAPVVREIARRIDQLVRERLRPGLERDCGPLPPGIR